MDRRPGAKLSGNVVALNDKYQTLMDVGADSFSQLLVNTGNEVVVRVPLNTESASR
jgi:hypothetical protein